MTTIIVWIFLGLVLLGTPITFALGLASLSFFVMHGVSLIGFAQRLVAGIDMFVMLGAPLFILAGNLMNTGGVTDRLFNMANAFVGHIKGGLGQVNVLGSCIFAGMSGSAIADAAGLGMIEIKAMKDKGFDLDFSVGVTAASAVIGPIIPPSTIMIIYGVTASVNVKELFLGGIIPGIMLTLVQMAYIYYLAFRHPEYPCADRFYWTLVWKELKHGGLSLLTPILIMGGILLGICTPTEAGAIASLYALCLGLFVYKEIKPKDIWKIFTSTIATTGVIMFLVACASAFGWCLVYLKVPQAVASFISSVSTNIYVVYMLVIVVYIILGMLMEATAIVITTVPIILPIIIAVGGNAVHFGVVLAILMSLGTITPPVGTVMFILNKVTGMTIPHFARIIMPWCAMILSVVILLIFFPQLITFIPSIV